MHVLYIFNWAMFPNNKNIVLMNEHQDNIMLTDTT